MPNQALSYTRVIYIGILTLTPSSFEGVCRKNLVYLMCIAATTPKPFFTGVFQSMGYLD